MNAQEQKAFYYHADANALGGVLEQPLQRIVSNNASVSLAAAGGFRASRVGRFHVDGLVSVDAAHVRVSGTEHKGRGRWRTIATATVERLNVLDVVTADRIVAQVSVMHPDGDGCAEISLNGTQFVNLQVNGTPVRFKLDRRLLAPTPVEDQGQEGMKELPQGSSPCFSDLLKVAEEQHRERADMPKDLADRLAPRLATSDPWADLKEKGSALCSLVQEVQLEKPAEGYGRMLHVPDFGNIFLGELLVTRFSAQLTMLRLEMGCMAQGSLSCCSASSNGRTMP